MIPWQSTAHFILDRDGILWFHFVDDDEDVDPIYHHLGPIESAAGEVALDLAHEAAELLDLWRDGFDERAEQRETFYRSLGDPYRW